MRSLYKREEIVSALAAGLLARLHEPTLRFVAVVLGVSWYEVMGAAGKVVELA